jgi:hypothetical protein
MTTPDSEQSERDKIEKKQSMNFSG